VSEKNCHETKSVVTVLKGFMYANIILCVIMKVSDKNAKLQRFSSHREVGNMDGSLK
jgi:hypothetical protein